MQVTRRMLLTVVLGLLVLIALGLLDNDGLQIILGVAFGLIVPGYLLSHALLPGKMLGAAERALLSIGLSMAVVALGGLGLNLTHWGLQGTIWVIWLAIISLISAGIALVRGAWRSAPSVRVASGLHIREIALLGIAGLILVATLVVAMAPAPADSIEGYTNFSVVPATSNDPAVVEFNITSMETHPMHYVLEVKVNNQLISHSAPITLNPGEEWAGMLSIPVQKSNAVRIEANLYRLDQPGIVYRQVVLNHSRSIEK